MVTNLYVIYDRLAGECSPISLAPNDAVACRQFYSYIQNGRLNPVEFQLYKIGTLDSCTMKLSNTEKLEVPTAKNGDGEGL
ncbi:MAG: hypothetical protein Ta2B_10560 [Termitinemataceae bacterium]|nr:MAG: hypothetical protein Ta2B_10560 [Termitinemataceae bacterium]